MSKATEIFKLQRAVFGGDLCLIYNESHSVMGQYPTTKDDLEILQGEFKAYFWGKHNDKTGKNLSDIVRKTKLTKLSGSYGFSLSCLPQRFWR